MTAYRVPLQLAAIACGSVAAVLMYLAGKAWAAEEQDLANLECEREPEAVRA